MLDEEPMPEPEDWPTRRAGRPLVRRTLGQRLFVRLLRRSKARELLRDWRRVQPKYPPRVFPWSGPYPPRARRGRRRPVHRR